MSDKTWSTPYQAAAFSGVLAVCAALGAAVGPVDNPGRLLLAVAAVLLAGVTAHVTALRPRLAADSVSVRVRAWSGRHVWPWHSVRTRVVRTRRFGREVVSLELDGLDAGGVERLVILGRLDLGADPEDVAAELAALRSSAG